MNFANLLDEIKEIFWDLRGTSFLLKNSMDLLSSKESDLRDSVLITEDDSDLTLGETLFGVFDNNVDHFTRGEGDVGGGLP